MNKPMPVKFLLLFLMLITFENVKSQTTSDTSDPWVNYMTPADVHKMLDSYSGDFNLEITMWMSEQNPVVVNVGSINKMILGNRFLELTQTGNMMGMDYQARTTLAFNNSDKKFTLISITNMGTGVLALTGFWNEAIKMASLTGQITDPVSKKIINVRAQVSFVDGDTILIENFDQSGNEKERKSIQYKFVRKK